jgi:thiamine biosynthesis protein ThiI
MRRCVIIHYHEVGLKRGNRSFFIRQLEENLARATAGLGGAGVKRLSGRLVLWLAPEAPWPALKECLAQVPGVAYFARGFQSTARREQLTQDVLMAVQEAGPFRSFRVRAKRAFKEYPLTSPQIGAALGTAIQEQTGAAVDLSNNAELTIYVEVLPDQAFIYFEKVPGAGGLPVGTSGTVVVLLSGGIDSPVAAYRMLKRGCRTVFVHFHAFPYVSTASQEKVRQLVHVLSPYQGEAILYLVPFGDAQREIVVRCPMPYRVVLYRRMMMRIAERLGARHGAKALVTGESLGQVASQTLENLAAIEDAASLLVLRPLIGMDKAEIAEQAQQIGTYAISIQPDEDCCALFVPEHPATRSDLAGVRQAEAGLDSEALVTRCVAEAEQVVVKAGAETRRTVGVRAGQGA